MASDLPPAEPPPTALEVLVLLLNTIADICQIELYHLHAAQRADLAASGLPSQEPPPAHHPEAPRG